MEVDNEYIMSPKDLCTIDFLDQISDAGIRVLKIEGRGRAPEYVAKVINCYRDAIDSVADGTYDKDKVIGWMPELEKVYNRGILERVLFRSKIRGMEQRIWFTCDSKESLCW